MGGEGAADGYNGCTAHPGYLLQQKLTYIRPWLRLQQVFIMLCTLQSIDSAFYLQQLLFCKARLCGDVPEKPASPGLYRTGAGRL
jgi:hypothetical protein